MVCLDGVVKEKVRRSASIKGISDPNDFMTHWPGNDAQIQAF